LFIDGYKLGRRPWTPRAEWVEASQDVMAAVAQDPYGIGIVGLWPPDSGWEREGDLGKQAKVVALAENEDAHYSHAGVGDVYPLTGSIRMYFGTPAGKPLEPWMREYIRLALSREGQELLQSLSKENGYITLEPAKAMEELSRLK
jgi:phosphate transport system substrate-binding protein